MLGLLGVEWQRVAGWEPEGGGHGINNMYIYIYIYVIMHICLPYT